MGKVEIPDPVEGWNPLPGDSSTMAYWDGREYTRVAAREDGEWITRPVTDARAKGWFAASVPRWDETGLGAGLVSLLLGGVVVAIAWSFVHATGERFPDSEASGDLIVALIGAPMVVVSVWLGGWVAYRRRNVVLGVLFPAVLMVAMVIVAGVGASLAAPSEQNARACGSVSYPRSKSSGCVYWRDQQRAVVEVVLVGGGLYAAVALVGTTTLLFSRRARRIADGH